MSTLFNTTNNLSGKSYQYNAGAWANNDNRYNTSYTYDANGNILTLSRHGGADEEGNVEEIDDLIYHYQNGNTPIVRIYNPDARVCSVCNAAKLAQSQQLRLAIESNAFCRYFAHSKCTFRPYSL